MKKIVITIAVLVCSIFARAQSYAVLHIEDVPGGSNYPEYNFCAEEYNGVIIYAQPGCQYNEWIVDYTNHYQNVSSIVLDNNEEGYYFVNYSGCGINRGLSIFFLSSEIDNPFSEPVVWKRQGESIILNTNLDGYNFLWSNGSNENQIEVSEPGIYSVTISDGICLNQTFYIEVRDNVELYRATCDLRTNLNQVTWQTTPQQAEYISAVNIYRNTYQLIATVPYLDGSFTDDIGSESTQWQYHVVAVDNDGNECPIPSYWKRTIHLDHVQGTGGGEILQWTPYEEENPAKDVVIAYGIYDVVNGEPNHVMDVGNFTNVYAYNPNDFDGYGTVAAIFEGKSRDLDDLAFSNLTEEVLNVGENSLSFNIYPNPSNGRVTIRGTGMLTISNMIGQIIFQQEIDGESFVELPAGVYVAKLGNSNQKVVVE